jgi:hypothetical protein
MQGVEELYRVAGPVAVVSYRIGVESARRAAANGHTSVIRISLPDSRSDHPGLEISAP